MKVDESGPQLDTIFQRIDQDCLKYNVLQIDTMQDKMVQEFMDVAQNVNASERFHVYDQTNLKNSLNFAEVTSSIIDSISAQVKKTNDYLNSEDKDKKDRCVKSLPGSFNVRWIVD